MPSQTRNSGYSIPVSAAYGTDPKKVKDILLGIADTTIKNTEYLLKEPVPKVFFLEFSDSSLKFILYVWAKKYNLPDEVKDSINSQIAERFAAEGIEIPFPQIGSPVEKIIMCFLLIHFYVLQEVHI